MNQKQSHNFANYGENVYWLALQDSSWLIPTRKVVRVFEECGSLKDLWQLPHGYLHSLNIDDKSIRKLSKRLKDTEIEELREYLRYLDQEGIKLIRYVDKEYPEALKTDIDNPPLMLFHKGSLLNLEGCVAISGTRNCSLYGRHMARSLAKALATEGYTVVSGLARGTDEWAHSGALEVSKGKSLAVLAWMKPIYPREHTALLNDILKRGAAISELLRKPFNRSARGKFVQRNRIISGISSCLVALESKEEGGTVHQVRIAISQGRKVFALKPRGNREFKKGFKKFVDMGASPMNSSKDVLSFLRNGAPPRIKERKLDSFYQHKLISSKENER